MKSLENTVVWLKTREEYQEYMQMAENEGWTWKSGDKPTKLYYFCVYSSGICVDVKPPMQHYDYEYCVDHCLKIITLQELKNMNKTLKNLEVNDMIANNGSFFRKILAVIHRDADGSATLYAVSDYSNSIGCEFDEFKSAWAIFTDFELEKFGYKPYIKEEVDKVEELTMEQVCSELGRTIKIKK